jgi:hypothetical protein
VFAHRRAFIRHSATALGAAALTGLTARAAGTPGAVGTHFAGKAKRVIYLFLAGGPSHIDTLDYKPELRKVHGKELPESIRNGQRITGMTSGQKNFPCVAPMFNFKQYGARGAWVNSDLLPRTGGIIDDICVLRSVHTEAINHDPAITYITTGNQQPGRPSMGAWLSYGLGAETENLPAFAVMISQGRGQKQALYSRLWGSGFLPSKHQGVQLRAAGDPVLYLSDPPGLDRAARREQLDVLGALNRDAADKFGDPETQARIAQYEMAFRMQTAVPEVTEFSKEPQKVLDLYGPDVKRPGSFAGSCLLARRMVERGVRMVQIFHQGWDQHGALPRNLRLQCEDIDQASAGLVRDQKRLGMLDDTLVVCGGEFGRTIYSQGALSEKDHGRDHHGRCFTTWLAGGGIKPGIGYGATDDFCYNVTENPVHIRDLNATLLHCLGIDHRKLTFKYQGLDQRLTGAEEARVVKEILA